MMKHLVRGVWPWGTRCRGLRDCIWRVKCPRGKRVVGQRWLLLSEAKANVAVHQETFPHSELQPVVKPSLWGKCWKPPSLCRRQRGWPEPMGSPGRMRSGESWLVSALHHRLFWFFWSHQSNSSCRSRCRQWHGQQPSFAELGQQKPIFQTVTWVKQAWTDPLHVHVLQSCIFLQDQGFI